MKFKSIRTVPKNLLVSGIIFLDDYNIEYDHNDIANLFAENLILLNDSYNLILKYPEMIWYSFETEVKEIFNEI